MFSVGTFLLKVKTDNTHFKKWSRSSSLDDLIRELQTGTYNSMAGRARIERQVAFLPHAKQTRYSQSLGYLSQQLGIRIGAVPTKGGDDL